MYDKKTAFEIKEMVEKEKVFLWKKEINYLEGEEIILFLYSSREVKEEHEKQMEGEGWITVEHKSKERLYSSFYEEEKVCMWAGCYGRINN